MALHFKTKIDKQQNPVSSDFAGVKELSHFPHFGKLMRAIGQIVLVTSIEHLKLSSTP